MPRVILSLAVTVFCIAISLFAAWVLAITVMARQRVVDEALMAGVFAAGFLWIALLIFIWRGASIQLAHLVRRFCMSGVLVLATTAFCVAIEFIIRGKDKEVLMAGLVFLGASLLILVWATPVINLLTRRTTAKPQDIHCPNCKYLLTGLTTLRCPECGTSYTIDELLIGQQLLG